MGSRGLLRKILWKILRKPAEACRSLRKPYGNPTETLRKSYGNSGEIQWQNPTEILRKSCGSLRKSYGSLRRLPQANSKNSRSSLKFFLRKRFLPYGSPAEALRKPCGSPTEGLFENQNYCGSFRRSLYIIFHRCTPTPLIRVINMYFKNSFYWICALDMKNKHAKCGGPC